MDKLDGWCDGKENGGIRGEVNCERRTTTLV